MFQGHFKGLEFWEGVLLSRVGWVSLPSCFTPLELELERKEGGGREEGRVRGQQALYGWPRECKVKGTSVLPSSPMLQTQPAWENWDVLS